MLSEQKQRITNVRGVHFAQMAYKSIKTTSVISNQCKNFYEFNQQFVYYFRV